ncbi:MAG: CoA pyrophosphatase [Proteobacteria bacterium]|nr:CoA pyrophosphatase [Pseudomonadota bacterium]
MEQILQRIPDHQAAIETLEGGRCAAVAIIFRPADVELELMVIKRATHASDPWSGQMGFPGGKIDPTDKDARAAAEREVLEEVGLPLSSREYVGRLDDILGIAAPIKPGVVLSPFVYRISSPGSLTLNREVAEALWVPLSRFSDPAFSIDFEQPRAPGTTMSAIRLSDNDQHLLWGLSYRVMEAFWKAAGPA